MAPRRSIARSVLMGVVGVTNCVLYEGGGGTGTSMTDPYGDGWNSMGNSSAGPPMTGPYGDGWSSMGNTSAAAAAPNNAGDTMLLQLANWSAGKEDTGEGSTDGGPFNAKAMVKRFFKAGNHLLVPMEVQTNRRMQRILRHLMAEVREAAVAASREEVEAAPAKSKGYEHCGSSGIVDGKEMRDLRPDDRKAALKEEGGNTTNIERTFDILEQFNTIALACGTDSDWCSKQKLHHFPVNGVDQICDPKLTTGTVRTWASYAFCAACVPEKMGPTVADLKLKCSSSNHNYIKEKATQLFECLDIRKKVEEAAKEAKEREAAKEAKEREAAKEAKEREVESSKKELAEALDKMAVAQQWVSESEKQEQKADEIEEQLEAAQQAKDAKEALLQAETQVKSAKEKVKSAKEKLAGLEKKLAAEKDTERKAQAACENARNGAVSTKTYNYPNRWKAFELIEAIKANTVKSSTFCQEWQLWANRQTDYNHHKQNMDKEACWCCAGNPTEKCADKDKKTRSMLRVLRRVIRRTLASQ